MTELASDRLAPYRARRRLRFGDCDPAGIAYYPRYLEMCDDVIEDWTEDVLGVSRRTLHMDMGLATPTVSLAVEFAAVSRLGDWLDFVLTVLAVGRSSVQLRLSAACDAEHRFQVESSLVLVGGDPMKSLPWPDEWRSRLTPPDQLAAAER